MASFSSLPVQDNIYVCQIVWIINSTKDGMMTLKTLCSSMNSDYRKLWSILTRCQRSFDVQHQYSDLEQINPTKEIITVKASASLCKKHIRKGNVVACDGKCGKLHICRTHLLLPGQCRFYAKDNCIFGHDIESLHNREVLREGNMNTLSYNELSLLYRRMASRTETTLPVICCYYNDVKGNKCSKKVCSCLHICKDFVNGQCTHVCQRNHSLKTKEARKVLKMFAMEDWSKESLMDVLKKFSKGRRQMDSDLSESDSEESEDSEDDEGSPIPTMYLQPAGQQNLLQQPPMNKGKDDPADTCSGCRQNCDALMALKIQMDNMESEMRKLKTVCVHLQSTLEKLM